jgi:hypothetical protein
MNQGQTARMDLIELARTVQQDHERQIKEATRRVRLMDRPSPVTASRNLPPAPPTGPRSGQSIPSASTAR